MTPGFEELLALYEHEEKLAIQFLYRLLDGRDVFSLVATVRPDIVGRLRGSPVDCFEDDSKIPFFLSAVEVLW